MVEETKVGAATAVQEVQDVRVQEAMILKIKQVAQETAQIRSALSVLHDPIVLHDPNARIAQKDQIDPLVAQMMHLKQGATRLVKRKSLARKRAKRTASIRTKANQIGVRGKVASLEWHSLKGRVKTCILC